MTKVKGRARNDKGKGRPPQKRHCEGEPKLRAEGAAAAGDEAILLSRVMAMIK